MRHYPFDHHSAEFVQNHRDVYQEMRRTCPVAHTDAHGGFWVLSRHKDVVAVAQDDENYSSAISLLIPPGNVDRLIPLQSDPPELTKYRKALMPFFTSEALGRLEPGIRSDVDAAVSDMVRRGHGDMVADLAGPIPAKTTMRLLGLDTSMWSMFARPINAVTFSEPGTAAYIQAEADIGAFTQTIEAEVDARIAKPLDDFISTLTLPQRSGEKFSRAEVVDLVRMIIFGGMDTVTGAIGNITAILAQRGDLQAQLAANPDQIPSAIEEFLRFEAPIQGFARKATCPVSLEGHEIAEGELIWLNWGAANHDSEAFAAPNEIDILRHPNRHLTFGIGRHICTGARLARLELRVFLETLLQRAPIFELDEGGIEWPRTIGQLLGKKAVHIRFAR